MAGSVKKTAESAAADNEANVAEGEGSADIEAGILENVKDLALEMQRLCKLANCPDLAAMFAAAAAEAHHQAQRRER